MADAAANDEAPSASDFLLSTATEKLRAAVTCPLHYVRLLTFMLKYTIKNRYQHMF